MPELAEVEIAARNLRRWALGRTLVELEGARGAGYVFRPAGAARLARALEGARFTHVDRHGKQLMLTLERDAEGPCCRGGAPMSLAQRGGGRRAPRETGLLAHLGMTGKWLRRKASEEPPRFSRARLELDDGHALHFVDQRLFGRLRLVPEARFDAVPELEALGPDPLKDGIDVPRLAGLLARSRLPVKVRLMDQAILPGVGNIVASESCFRARVSPRRRSASLARGEVEAIAGAILDTVQDAIARQEGPELQYVEEGGENPFLVYDRAGERCPRCKRGKIERFVQAQRATFHCPRCQK
ncbi:MAG: DNA-formamidopyrimidine glycosylase family protein [Anaeromyxobacteraceae bacterium]